MESDMCTLEKFTCDDTKESLSLKWRKWKRAFDIYTEAYNISTEKKKLVPMLHIGGLQLQEIFDSLPNMNVADNTDENVYKNAIQKLDEYFAPKQNLIFERHLFRQMTQQHGEQFNQFLARLRHQAAKCMFSNEDEHIIDQVAEKSNMPELRKQLLLLTNNEISLNSIIAKANALESLSRQLQDYEKNTIDIVKMSRKETCIRCGSNTHISKYNKCPARYKRCMRCGNVGHYKQLCKTKKMRR